MNFQYWRRSPRLGGAHDGEGGLLGVFVFVVGLRLFARVGIVPAEVDNFLLANKCFLRGCLGMGALFLVLLSSLGLALGLA